MVIDQQLKPDSVPQSLLALGVDPEHVHEMFVGTLAAKITHAQQDGKPDEGEWIVVLNPTGEAPVSEFAASSDQSRPAPRLRVQYVKAQEGELRKGKPRVFWVRSAPEVALTAPEVRALDPEYDQ